MISSKLAATRIADYTYTLNFHVLALMVTFHLPFYTKQIYSRLVRRSISILRLVKFEFIHFKDCLQE